MLCTYGFNGPQIKNSIFEFPTSVSQQLIPDHWSKILYLGNGYQELMSVLTLILIIIYGNLNNSEESCSYFFVCFFSQGYFGAVGALLELLKIPWLLPGEGEFLQPSTVGSMNFCFLRALLNFMVVYYLNQSKKDKGIFLGHQDKSLIQSKLVTSKERLYM